MWILEELQTETGVHSAFFYKKAKQLNMKISGAFGSDNKFLGLAVNDKDGEFLMDHFRNETRTPTTEGE